MNNAILVIGANGKNGRAAISHLVARGERVRGVGRNPDKITQRGVEPGLFDWQRQETYSSALSEVDRVYLIVPEDMPDGPARAAQFIEHAAAAGVGRFVVLSAMGVDQFEGHPLQQVEQAVTATMPHWTILRPNWFMQNFSDGLFRPNICDRDLIAAPAGDARVSFIDTDDIGSAAAAALSEPSEDNAAHELTGPEALTFDEVADHIGRATGRVVRYQPLELDDPALLTKLGLPDMDPRPVLALFSRVLAGQEAPVTDSVRELTGRSPTSFATFARRAARSWKSTGQPGAVLGGQVESIG